MKKKSRFYRGLAVFTAVLLLLPVFKVSASGLQDAQKEKEQLENSLSDAKKLVDSLEDSQDNIEDKVAQLDTQLTSISKQITTLQDKLRVKQDQISQKGTELTAVEKEEKQQYESMKKRIQFMYEKSQNSVLDIVLSSADFGDFLNRVEYAREISLYDRNMLKKYQQTQQEIEQVKAELEQEQTDLQKMEDQVEQDKAAAELLLGKKKSELQKVQSDIKDASKSVDVIQAEIEAQKQIIEQIKQAEAAKKAAEAAAKKAAEEAAKANGTTVTDTAGDDKYTGGAFTWPCPSSKTVSSDYGSRLAPTEGASTNHKGIDISASYAADIVAAADGTVIFAGYSSSGGNYVMIDHGGSLYSVYMHASSLVVNTGDTVTKGQVIAKVGSTGISTGNHLHFGVSLNGGYVSPWSYLGK